MNAVFSSGRLGGTGGRETGKLGPRMAWMRINCLFTLLALGCGPVFPAAAKDYAAERFDAELVLDPGGTLEITETITFRFEGGPFRRVVRKLPVAPHDRILILEVSLDGQVLPRGDQPGQAEVSAADSPRITWRMAPFSGQTHRYTVRYRVEGALKRVDGADRLDWPVLPDEYDYPIESGLVTLRYPPSWHSLGPPFTRRTEASLESSPGEVRFRLGRIKPGRPMAIVLEFPGGTAIEGPPAWQQRDLAIQDRLPWIALGAAVLGLGLIFAVLLYLRNLRAAERLRSPASPSSEPPGKLPPALAAALVRGGHPAPWPSVLGTLFDLAARDALRFATSPSSQGKPVFLIQRRGTPPGLRPHEHLLLEHVFAGGSTLPIDAWPACWQTLQPIFSRTLKEELDREGLTDPVRRRSRTVALQVATLTTVVGGLSILPLALVFLPVAGPWPALFGVAIMLPGLVGLIGGTSLPVLSLSGGDLAARWTGFATYLRQVCQGRKGWSGQDSFHQYLPFAAATGQASAWLKVHKDSGQDTPEWLVGASTSPTAPALEALSALMVCCSAAGESAARAVSVGSGAGGCGGGSSSAS